MFYLHEEGKLPFDVIFKIVRYWKFPETDLKSIKDLSFLPGGELFIEYDSQSGHAFMTGPAETVFVGDYLL